MMDETRQGTEPLPDEDMVVLVPLIARHLPITSIISLAGACRLCHDLLIPAGNVPSVANSVWADVFRGIKGSGDCSAVTEDANVPSNASWLYRVRLLTYDICGDVFKSVPEHVGIVGKWHVAVCDESALFFHDVRGDGSAVAGVSEFTSAVEIVWGSVGWFRARIGGADYVVWSRGYRSKQSLNDRKCAAATEMAIGRGKVLPLMPGLKIEKNQWSITVDRDGIHVAFPKRVLTTLFIPRNDPSSVVFRNVKLQDLTFRA